MAAEGGFPEKPKKKLEDSRRSEAVVFSGLRYGKTAAEGGIPRSREDGIAMAITLAP